jgi:hypothetical protein
MGDTLTEDAFYWTPAEWHSAFEKLGLAVISGIELKAVSILCEPDFRPI